MTVSSALNLSVTSQTAVGYRYVDTLYYTSSGTFTKASYPWLRAIRVKCQAGGGGGGGCDWCNSVGEAAAGTGGGGGCYAESFITDIASLAGSVTVTVGAGGAGGAGGTSGSANGSQGSQGGDSEFGAGTAYEVSAGGGNGGNRGLETTQARGSQGAGKRLVGTGDLVVTGSPSDCSYSCGTTDASIPFGLASAGGNSTLGAGGNSQLGLNVDVTGDGNDGGFYGGGGGGALGLAATTATDGGTGGNGADGIVIVELYA